ncbi:MAG: hypothetical protein KF856_12195 [Cyclobacteriaceae bacterium]|nr:hypothetical protein [Cyclobacteriaceae bacterium]
MRVANIVIAHTNPTQVCKLVNQFPADLFHNYVHIDARQHLKAYSSLLKQRNVTLLANRRKLVWAGYGFVQVTLDALNLIKKSKSEFCYINLLSGMDFPIKPVEKFHQYLAKEYSSEQNEFFEILSLDIWPGAHRFERYHLCDWTIKGRYFTERIINKVIPKRKFYNGKMIPFGRSAWFTATDQFIKYAVEFIDRNPDFIKFLKTTWSPDEFIWNTLIMNSPFQRRVHAGNLRYIDWSEGKVSPKVFTQEDLSTLLNVPDFLARKFDERIDNIILQQLEQKNRSQQR